MRKNSVRDSNYANRYGLRAGLRHSKLALPLIRPTMIVRWGSLRALTTATCDRRALTLGTPAYLPTPPQLRRFLTWSAKIHHGSFSHRYLADRREGRRRLHGHRRADGPEKGPDRQGGPGQRIAPVCRRSIWPIGTILSSAGTKSATCRLFDEALRMHTESRAIDAEMLRKCKAELDKIDKQHPPGHALQRRPDDRQIRRRLRSPIAGKRRAQANRAGQARSGIVRARRTSWPI